MINRFRPAPAWLLMAALVAGAGCREPPVPVTRALPVHDREVRLTAAPPSHGEIDNLAYLARNHLAQNLRVLDETLPQSDIAKINRTATTVRLPISSDTFRVLDLGQYYARLTDGYYDYTLGPVTYLWGFKQPLPPPRPPEEEALFAALDRTGMDKVQLFDDGSIAITSPGARIELGPLRIAYAVDLAIVDLRRRRFDRIFLDAGQVARCLGNPGEALRWPFPVVPPGGPSLGELALESETAPAVAWVSLADRTLRIGDQEVTAYLNPHTGIPADQAAFVLVTGPTATKAMALAQAVLVAGVERARAFLPRFERYDVLALTTGETPELLLTPGMATRFTAAPNSPGGRRIDLPPAAEPINGEPPREDPDAPTDPEAPTPGVP